MPLPIRDGNQSLTTLSTILVSNSHIPAHTVISFGTQGITDIATAVSGVELGPNTLNALENITVTLGQVTITGGLTDAQLRASAVTISGGIYLSDAQVALGNNAPPEAVQIGGYNLADNKLYPIAVDSNGVQSVGGTVTASVVGSKSFGTDQYTLPINADSEDSGNTAVQVGFDGDGLFKVAGYSNPFPISGTVTANVLAANAEAIVDRQIAVGSDSEDFNSGTGRVAVDLVNKFGYSIGGVSNPIQVSGTVTASLNGVVVTASDIGYPSSKLVAGVYDIYGSQFGNNNPFPISGAIRNNGINNDPWVYIPRLTMSHPDVGSFVLDGYYRFNGENTWGNSNFNYGNVPYLSRALEGDQYIFRLMVHDEANDVEIEMASSDSASPDFPTVMYSTYGTLVSGSLTFNTEQRESYGVRVTNSVTIGNSVTASISGTVTIGSALPTGTNRIGVVTIGAGTVTIGAGTAQIGSVTASISNTVTASISGTVPISISSVTIGSALPAGTNRIGVVTIGAGTVTIGAGTAQIGSVTASVFGVDILDNTIPKRPSLSSMSETFSDSSSGYALITKISSSVGNPINPLSNTELRATAVTIAGSVTIGALPSGALTTRFGSITTAGTAQITTAVTNTSRKYLLAQNISSSAVTIGVGFSPTTTQGIQLNSGAGLTFDVFCPTGAVYWLGSVTGASFTILEG